MSLREEQIDPGASTPEPDVRMPAAAEAILENVKDGIVERVAAGAHPHMELIAFGMKSPNGLELAAPELTAIRWASAELDTLATSRQALEKLDAVGCVLVMPSVMRHGTPNPPRVVVARLEHRKVARCFVALVFEGGVGEWCDVTADVETVIGPYARLLPLMN